MGTVGLFITSFLVGLTGAMMPGPMLSVTLDRTAKHGWLAGPLVVVGHGVLELLLIAGILFGAGQLISAPVFTGTVGVVGGAVLVWFGVGIMKDSGSVRLPGTPERTQARNPSPAHPARQWLRVASLGASTSLSNPYWLLWWGTVGAGYVSLALSRSGTAGVTMFFAGHILADLAWFTAMAIVMSRGGRLLPTGAFVNLLRTLGFFLIIMAGYFVYSGADTLLHLL